MFGDREHDIIGANHAGIDSVAVAYDYGSIAELRGSLPTYLCEDIKEVGKILKRSK